MALGGSARPGRIATPERVRERVRTLPGRFRPESANGLAAEWELRVGSDAYTVSIAEHRCSTREGDSVSPQARIWADAETWLAMDEGRLAGFDAFMDRRLRVEGNADLAVRTQLLFRPYRRARRDSDLDQVEIRVDDLVLSAYVAGHGEPMLLLHGLGGSKISWLPVLGALAATHRVVVPDLPGHGESTKPVTDFSPRFYARIVRRLMDGLGLDPAVVVGNSMGGRVALELALRSPGRVTGMVLLGPALPGMRWRHLMNVTRMVPAEFGAIPFPLRERWMRRMVRRMFARPEEMWPDTLKVAADEFMRVYRDPRARMAFFSSLRHIVTEAPQPFWSTMRRVRQPVLVVFGEQDHLVPGRLGERLVHHLPHAELLTFEDVGHVPQVEAPARTLEAVRAFLARTQLMSPPV